VLFRSMGYIWCSNEYGLADIIYDVLKYLCIFLTKHILQRTTKQHKI